MTDKHEHEHKHKHTHEKGIVLTEEQRRRRRNRSIVLGLVLAGFAILFYIVTVVKLGPAIMSRPI